MIARGLWLELQVVIRLQAPTSSQLPLIGFQEATLTTRDSGNRVPLQLRAFRLQPLRIRRRRY